MDGWKVAGGGARVGGESKGTKLQKGEETNAARRLQPRATTISKPHPPRLLTPNPQPHAEKWMD